MGSFAEMCKYMMFSKKHSSIKFCHKQKKIKNKNTYNSSLSNPLF